MSSDRFVAENAPWYLNLTLDEGERAEMERLLAESDENRQELVQAREAARLYGHRLPAELLIDHVFGEGQDAIPADLLARYLAVSPVGRAELEMLEESRRLLDEAAAADAADSTGGPVVPIRTVEPTGSWRRLAMAASLVGVTALGLAGWQWSELRDREGRLAAMRSELASALEAEATPVEAEPAVERATDLEERLRELAAENELLAAGKSDLVEQVEQREAQIADLDRRLERQVSPRPNLEVVDLYPGDMVLRGETQSDRRVAIERTSDAVALILNSGIDAEQEVTSMRIVAADGEVYWSSEERPERDDLGTFTVSVPASRFAPGVYTIELVDGPAAEGVAVESYQFEIR